MYLLLRNIAQHRLVFRRRFGTTYVSRLQRPGSWILNKRVWRIWFKYLVHIGSGAGFLGSRLWTFVFH